MKLTVIGGGSTYTPELVDGFCRLQADLPVDELCLVDPDERRLGLVAGMARRMFARAGHPGRVIATDDVRGGADGADVVLIQLRIGGQQARNRDETWPHEVGVIGQETTGPGGFAKALRTVPVVLDIAETVRSYAKPDAWIVDFTNPVGIVTRALLQAGHRAVGLCNVAIGFQRRFAALLGVDHRRIRLDHVGLNHLTWERAVHLADPAEPGGSRDVLPLLLDRYAEVIAAEEELPLAALLLQRAVPSYYLRYYYAHDAVVREQLAAPNRAERVMEIEGALLRQYADPAVDTKPEELGQRGGAFYSEAAVDLIASLRGDRRDVQIVNIRNDGTLPFLPDDHVVEVPATIAADGLAALPAAVLPGEMRGLISHVAEYERLALDAALRGGRDRVVRTLLAHPLVGQIDAAERLADLLLAHNAAYLPWAR